jgi:hypothetical protein
MNNTQANDLAYPLIERRIDQGESINFGLTKREAFAMAAMQGLLGYDAGIAITIKQYAESSVAYADALIAALNKPQETAHHA